jgi:2-amino-4-hydroxy-6-hydroxymethyldihydropteridine diphosphokinase
MTKRDLYLGLGSNQGNRRELLSQAVQILTERIGLQKGLSAFYETAPWGFVSDHPFLNVVLLLSTDKVIGEIFQITREVERMLGRVSKSVNGVYSDRTMDIDILLYGDLVLEEDFHFQEGVAHLSIPHPLMCERRFVLEPLLELSPYLKHPITGVSFQESLKQIED